MPSLRDLDVVHRLNAPTRAAATRRRRLRKGAAIACLLLGAAIASPSGGSSATASGSVSSSAPAPAALRGRHVVRLTSNLPPPVDAARVDVWNTSGARLIACAPTYPNAPSARLNEVAGSSGAQSTALALTDAEMAKISRHLGHPGDASSDLVLSACL